MPLWIQTHSFACENLGTCCNKADSHCVPGEKNFQDKVKNHSDVPLLSGRRTPKAQGSVFLHLWPYLDAWCSPTATYSDSCPEILWTMDARELSGGCCGFLLPREKTVHPPRRVQTFRRGSGNVLVLTVALSGYWTAHTNTALKTRQRINDSLTWKSPIPALFPAPCANKISVK